MKKLIGGLICALALAGCASSSDNGDKDSKKSFTIGIVQHTTHPALDDAVKGFKDAMKKKNIDVKIVEKNAQGDRGTNDLITKQFVSDDVDLIYAVATPSASAALNATMGKDIPVVFNAVTDPADSKTALVKSMDKPGGNITGVSDEAPLEKQLQLIRDMLPEAKTIGMLYNIGEPNGKLQVEQVKALASKFNFTIQVKGISQSSEVASAAQQLAESSDCIYNITDNMIASSAAAITDKANAENIPVFAAEEGQMKDTGILASDSISYKKLGEQAANMAYDILVNGKNPGDIAVQKAQSTALLINKNTAKRLGITIPEELAKRASYIEE